MGLVKTFPVGVSMYIFYTDAKKITYSYIMIAFGVTWEYNNSK